MAAPGCRFAYVTLYVKDVLKACKFYTEVFGLKDRVKSPFWTEMETGPVTLCFTSFDQKEARLAGGVKAQGVDEPRQNVEIAFNCDDLNATIKKAQECGATLKAEPEPKEWHQTVAYLRDPDGIVIRVGTHVNKD
eukprot:jgi/Mesen1/6354/ME000328S05632